VVNSFCGASTAPDLSFSGGDPERKDANRYNPAVPVECQQLFAFVATTMFFVGAGWV
jgi:hypothetical protein